MGFVGRPTTRSGVFESLNLPSGASLLLGRISTSFSCYNKPYGYYADEQNSCRVFHVCNPSLFSDGEVQNNQYSFMCAEGTVFDQNEMTCKAEYDATPCQDSSKFYFRNEIFVFFYFSQIFMKLYLLELLCAKLQLDHRN